MSKKNNSEFKKPMPVQDAKAVVEAFGGHAEKQLAEISAPQMSVLFVSADTGLELKQRCEAFWKEGYRFQGGVSACPHGAVYRLVIAMVKNG